VLHYIVQEDLYDRILDEWPELRLSARYRYSLADCLFVIEPYLVLCNPLDRHYAYIKDYPMPGFHVLAGLEVKIR